MAIEVDLKCEVVGGASSFIQLTDTPNDYTGEAGKVPVVNGTEDGLEFANIAGGGVQTVTGDGVDNTDPLNPVMSYPVPSDIGLGNVDNTSDLDKPISTATQTALDGKEGDLNNPPLDNYVLASLADGSRFWTPNVAGAAIIEDGTSLRFGTNSDFGTPGNRRFAGGVQCEALFDDAMALGYNSHAGNRGVSLGVNVGFISVADYGLGIGYDIREIEAQSLVITGRSAQSDVGLRTKSLGSVMIGNLLNIDSTLPANGTVNGGVYIGKSLTSPNTNLGARAVMIGANLNCGASYEMTLIGKQTTVNASANYQRTVAIGDELVLNENGASNGVVIGYKAGGGVSSGTGAVGGQFVAIGTETFAGSWRCTLVGAFSRADYVSSTILGYGCYSGVAHGNIFGRGGYLLNSPITGGSSTLLHSDHTQDVLIIGNAYAKFTNPYVEGSDEIVDNVTAQNNGTIIHRITTASGLDVDTTPTASNVKGAVLDISAGVGTGTADSGDLTFSSAPAGVSGNTENALEIAAKIDAQTGVDTRFLLLDVTDGTVKRVEFGADDSAGAGFKVLKVAN